MSEALLARGVWTLNRMSGVPSFWRGTGAAAAAAAAEAGA